MSRNKLYTERLEICTTPNQRKKLEKVAAEAEITVNQVVRELIDSLE